MRPSFYIKKNISDTDPEILILYSTKTSSIILIPRELFETMQKGGLSSQEQGLLKELGFVVESREEERDEVLNYFDRISVPYVQIILVLNLDCNFSCRYCFENEIKTGSYMNKDVLEESISFIKKELGKGASELRLALYGGEPLLKPELIKDSLLMTKDICEKMNVRLRASVVTNGSLINRKITEGLTEIGLEGVRITLDGPPDIHNCFRPFKDGRKSFDIILNNTKEIIDILKRLEISGNYTEQNYRRFPELLDILLEEGITPDKVEMIRFEPVIKQPAGSTYKGGCYSINEPWVAEAGIFLREEILKRGYKTRGIEPIFCMVNNRRAFVINMDGRIYKCPGFVGIKQFQIGSVFEGVKDVAVYNPGRWKNEKCGSCIYLPLCYGGCRYMSYLRYGDLKRLDCQKPFFDKQLDAFIKQDIRYKRDIG